MGLGLPDHVAAGPGRSGDGPGLRPGPRQRGDRPGRQPGRDPVRRLVAALVLSINFAPVPDMGTLALGLAAIALAALIAFLIRQRRAANPSTTSRSLAPRLLGRGNRRGDRVRDADGRDVHRSAVPAERARLLDLRGRALDPPAAACMVVVAPRSAKLVEARGARFTLLAGYLFCFLGFLTMLLLWNEGISYWRIALAYSLVGIGVGFAGTPASHSPAPCRCSAPGWPRGRRTCSAIWAARSCSRSSARCSPPATRRLSARRSPPRPTRRRSPTGSQPSSRSLRGRRGDRGAEPPIRESDHGRGEGVLPRRCGLGLHGRNRRHPARCGARLSPLPEGGREKRLLARYHAEDT